MKHKLLILIYFLFITITVKAQLTLTGNGNGTVTVNYNVNDISLYNPGFDDVLIYIWINTNQNSTSTYFQDDWPDSGSLVSLTWNGVDAHEGLIDFNSHDFKASGGIIPNATTITDFNLILRNPTGSNQSADLLASTYGYTSSTLSITDLFKPVTKMYPNPASIDFSLNIDVEKLEIYSISGKLVKKYPGYSKKGTPFNISQLNKGVYFIKAIHNLRAISTTKLIKL